jgi:hypothetical protein
MDQSAAMSANDALMGGGGGIAPSTYIARRGQPNMQPGMMPPGMMQPGGMPMNTLGMAPAAAPAAPPVKKILVLTGQRVICPVTETLLEDINYEYRPESEKGEFYDDGTHGDLQADDNIYTNIPDPRYDVLSPLANRLKLTYLRLLELSEETNPLEFFRIPVATEEPLSRLPRVSDEERDRDETFLRQWHRQFLSEFRQDQQDPMSDFYPIFVPSPPRPPREQPAPPDDQFQPNAFALDNMIQSMVDQATASAYQSPDNYGSGGAGGGYGYGSGYEGGGGGGRRAARGRGYAGDRWTQARGDAARYSTYASSSYMRR